MPWLDALHDCLFQFFLFYFKICNDYQNKTNLYFQIWFFFFQNNTDIYFQIWFFFKTKPICIFRSYLKKNKINLYSQIWFLFKEKLIYIFRSDFFKNKTDMYFQIWFFFKTKLIYIFIKYRSVLFLNTKTDLYFY